MLACGAAYLEQKGALSPGIVEMSDVDAFSLTYRCRSDAWWTGLDTLLEPVLAVKPEMDALQ